MILWCIKCREFRKRNTPGWHECRFSSRHMLVPGHERMEKELRQIRENIAGSSKPNDEDLKKLGALEAVKNAESDEDDERGHLTAVVTIQVPDYYHELVMAGPVQSDILAWILWSKTHHVLHIARRALTKSDQRAGTTQAACLEAESYAAAQMFLNMGGPTPVENMSQNGSSTMPNTASCTDIFCFSQVAANV